MFVVLSIMMHLIPLHINRAKRSGRAEVLAGTAADAFVLVHGRHLHLAVRAFVVDHLNGSRRAVAGTVATRYAIGQYYTVFLYPHGMADMDVGFCLAGNGLDGTSRADFAATCAFGTAVTALKRHHGLHEMHQVGRRTQYVVGATGYTELTCRSMWLHVASRN